MLDVDASVVANPLSAFESTVPEGLWRRPLAEYPGASLTISDAETLAFVIQQAVTDVLGGTPEHYQPAFESVTFATPADAIALHDRPYQAMNELALVDDAGQVRWIHDWSTVAYRQLVRSAELGTITGDPLHPIIVVEKPYGNGFLLLWPELLQALELIDSLLIKLAAYGSVLAGGKLAVDKVRDRLKRGRESLEDKHTAWAELDAQPKSFQRFLIKRSWSASELAVLLGCSEEQAEGALWAFGLTPDEEGRWHLGGDDEAWFMNEAFTRAVEASMGGEEGMGYLIKQVDSYLRTGSWQVPPPDVRLDELDLEDV